MLSADVIRAGVKGTPLLYHYAIVAEINGNLVALHNPYGRTPVIDSMHAFNEKWIYEETCGIYEYPDNDYLLKKFETIRHKEYSLWDFNCEDFVNYMIGKQQYKTGKKDLLAGCLITGFLLFK